MLDNDKQIDAFAILTAEGSTTPPPAISYRTAIGLANSLANTIIDLLIDGSTYPEAISQYTAKLPEYVAVLTEAGKKAEGYIAAIRGYTSPSELLQMKLGWECYAKGNRLNPAPAFPLVEGLCDQEICQKMISKLKTILLEDLSAAMLPINEKVKAAAPPPGGTDAPLGASTPPPSFTPTEIKALKEATDALDTLFPEISSTSVLTGDYTDRINTSTATATKSLNNAVAITLTTGLVADPVMSAAIAAIMPPGVIAVLKED